VTFRRVTVGAFPRRGRTCARSSRHSSFMLASFPAGLVIYWAWNNTLSVIQQSVIMRKHGAKIELFDNIKAVFGKKKTQG